MIKKLLWLIPFLIFLVGFSSLGFSTVYYVKTTGNDGNTGLGITDALAWQTIGKANTTLTPGDTVYIMAGTYNEVINPTNSGTIGNYITYENYESDEVILTGGHVELSGWTLHSGSIYKANYAQSWYSGVWEDDFATAGYYVSSNSVASLEAVDEAGKHWPDSTNKIVYVWLKGSDNPSNHTMRMGASKFANMDNKSYIKIDGIKCYYSQKGVRLKTANYCIIQNCTLDYAYSNAVEISDDSNYNQILDNEIKYSGSWYRDSGNGIIISADCDHNLIQGNDVSVTGHNGITSYGSSGHAPHHNIIQDNVVYDCGSSGINANVYPYREIWRRNKSSGHTGAGIQTDSSDNVFAYNLCWNNGYLESNDSPNLAMYSVVSSDTDNNYIFHNVFYDSMGENMELGEFGAPATNDNNIFKNNIFYLSDEDAYMINVDATTLRSNVWKYNIIYDNVTVNVRCPGIGVNTLTWYEANYPSNFNNNIQQNPQFVDVANHKFGTFSSSPCINAGDWLTTITSETGSGTSFVVGDAGYFCDGYGITDGDEINIESGVSALITDVNYATNTITVDTTISWTQGNGICFSYDILGQKIRHAPDIGAHENQTNVLFFAWWRLGQYMIYLGK